MKIKIRKDFNKELRNMDSIIEDYFDGIQKLKETVGEIGTIWKGNDYQAFQRKMNDFATELNQLGSALTHNNEFLKDYNKASESIEEYYNNLKISLK